MLLRLKLRSSVVVSSRVYIVVAATCDCEGWQVVLSQIGCLERRWPIDYSLAGPRRRQHHFQISGNPPFFFCVVLLHPRSSKSHSTHNASLLATTTILVSMQHCALGYRCVFETTYVCAPKTMNELYVEGTIARKAFHFVERRNEPRARLRWAYCFVFKLQVWMFTLKRTFLHTNHN